MLRTRGHVKPPMSSNSMLSAESATTWVEVGNLRHQARCTCDWAGPKRVFFRNLAPVDALLHAARSGCAPAAPIQRPPYCLAPTIHAA
jgi:hypothetical protein